MGPHAYSLRTCAKFDSLQFFWYLTTAYVWNLCRLRIFHNKVLWKIFGLNREKEVHRVEGATA